MTNNFVDVSGYFQQEEKPLVDIVKPPIGNQTAGLDAYFNKPSDPAPRTVDEMGQAISEAEKPLPFGAIGWNPDRTPNYGEGVDGWYKSLVYRAYAPTEKVVDGETVLEKPSAATVLGRSVWNAFGEVLKGLQVPQQMLYEGYGKLKAAEYEADLANQSRPNLYEDPKSVDILRGMFDMASTTFSQTIGNVSESRTGIRRLPDATSDKIEEASVAWSKHNFGTSLYQPYIFDNYMKRVMNGENPYDLIEELSKPWANLAADLLFDPLNLIAIIAKPFQAVKIAKGAEVIKGMEGAVDVLKAAKGVDSVVDGVKAADAITEVAQKLVTRSGGLVDDVMKIGGRIAEKTQDAKFNTLKDVVNTVITPLLVYTKGQAAHFDEVLHAISKLSSKDVKVVEEGLTYLAERNLAHLYLTENAMDTSKMLGKFYESISPAAEKELIKILEGNDVKALFNFMAEKMGTIADDMFPDVAKIGNKLDEIAKFTKANPGVELPEELAKFKDFKLTPVAKKIAQLHNAAQTNVLGSEVGVRNINSFLNLIYLSSPGFAIRNFMTNTVQTAIDLGGAGLKETFDVTGGSLKYLEDVFGLVPESLAKAFGQAAEIGGKAARGAAEGNKGISKVLHWAMDWSGEMEEHAGAAVSAAVGKKMTNKMLRRGVFIEAMGDLKSAGFSDGMMNHLESLVRKHNGKTDVAVKEFIEQVSTGAIEHFRNPEMIFSKDVVEALKSFENGTLYDKVAAAMKSGTADDIAEALDTIVSKYHDAMKITEDIIAPNLEEPTFTKWLADVGERVSSEVATVFSKKNAVRSSIAEDIERVAKDSLSKESFTEYKKGASAVMEKANAFHDKLVSTVDSVLANKDPKAIKDTLIKLGWNKKMIGTPFDIRAADSYSVIKDKIWGFIAEESSKNYNKTIETTYNILDKMKPTGINASRNQRAVSTIADLENNIRRSTPYLNASTFKDGKVFLNKVKYWYDIGDYHKSVLAYADHLGLAQRVNAKAETTVWEVIAKKLGVNVGDVFREENYAKALKALDEYAGEAEQLRALKTGLKEFIAKEVDPEKAAILKKILNEARGRLTNGDLAGMDDFIAKVSENYPDGIKIMEEAGKKTKVIGLNEADDIETIASKLKSMESAIDEMPIMNAGEVATDYEMKVGNWDGFKRLMDTVKKGAAENFGKRELVNGLDEKAMTTLRDWAVRNESKMVDFRSYLVNNMKASRDFILHDYVGDKRNFDLALAYLMPYQFWYTRTYSKWLQRLAANPVIINRYADYRKFMEDQNKNLPEYMRNNLVLGESFGLTEGNELILNLEAALNPMNGLAGVDFTDKKKIVGSPGTFEYAWTNSLDSIGKYGPSVWSPIAWATAAWLSSKGENDAAARWAGRMIPVTAPVKAVASLANKNLELDPFVALFGEGTGTDPYERRRVGRSLMAMATAGKITKEQAYEAARTRSGEIWQMGVTEASKARAKGTISAYTLGVGFKMRTKNDADIDKFYEDYFNMWANADKFTPDEMRQYQFSIHQKYPFGDLVLLSSKGGDERDKAYSYSILSRIQPGKSNDVFTALGVNPVLVDKFYESKGDFSTWHPLDKEAFINGMVQLGTLLSIPPDTTAEQWMNVKTTYNLVNQDIKMQYGDDILEKIDMFYAYDYGSIEQDQYLKEHPEVNDAMNYKDYLIGTNQLLAPYYDGLKKIERYYDGEFRKKVETEVDKDFYYYYDVRDQIIDPDQKKAFENEIGWTAMYKKYIETKKAWDANVDRSLLAYEKYLPKTEIGMGYQAGDKGLVQQSVVEQLAPTTQPTVTWEQILQTTPIPQSLDKALKEYYQTDRILSSSESSMVQRLVNAVNANMGLDLSRDEVMRIASNYYGTIGY